MKNILEVCAASLESVEAAASGGAARVELCSALSEGGLTPSAGLISMARKVDGLGLHVLIRPRPGDFVYDSADTACMVADIKTAAVYGADGVVIGALRPDGSVDEDVCRRLIDAAGDMNVTFHRAFDMCSDQHEALERIIAMGCDRVLTSGGAASAFAGLECISALNRQAGGRIVIMPGSGVTVGNAGEILRQSGCHEIHASARSKIESAMVCRRPDVSMGRPGADEYCRYETDPAVVAAIVDAIEGSL